VCVRIININEIDLSAYPFDFDLTMAVILANADGTAYHRYGGRTYVSPMSMEGLVDIMRKGIQTHREYLKNPAPPAKQEPQLLPVLINERLKGVMQPVTGCFHCHYAREAKQLLTLESGDWTPDQFWIFPQPERLGMVMDQKQQYRVKEVIAGSAAASGGIEEGDLIQSLAGKRILSKYDIQWQLDQSDGGALEIPFSLRRDQKLVEGSLALAAGWKVGNPKEYSWRVENPFTAHMIKFLPTPGLVGDRLEPDELGSLGLMDDAFALRVTKLNYGPHQAGIRVGDVILAVAERSDFATTRDFYAWCEELRRAGRDLKIQVRREGNEMAMMVSLSYLNYSRMEKAPRVEIGFIPQQLPGDGGVRVGHVTDDSSAENAGLLIGDRISMVDGERAPSRDKFVSLIDQKAPGELIMLDVTRRGQPLQLSYLLPGENQVRSDVARLDGRVVEKGQRVKCLVAINLPPGRHIYSAHKKGVGVPTRIDFRGTGYRLVDGLLEPVPTPSADGDWILEGRVEFVQEIEITDPQEFQMLLQVYAQVCDDSSCHEFRAVLENDGEEEFFEFRGDFERQPQLASGQ
jgi:S1-C subfamily serine protease